MSGNRDLVLAGVSGGGAGGTGLAWFGDTDTPGPTSATSTLDTGFLDAGLISEEGLTRGVDEDSNDINAYGLGTPVRTIVSRSKITFQIKMLESNPAVALAVYHRLALGSLTPDVDGQVAFTEGAHRTVRYAGVFDIVDGLNHMRAHCTSLEVTDREEFKASTGEVIGYGITMTAYPDANGNSVYWYLLLDALAS